MTNEQVETITSAIDALGYTYSISHNPMGGGTKQVSVINNKVVVTDTIIFTATKVTETDLATL